MYESLPGICYQHLILYSFIVIRSAEEGKIYFLLVLLGLSLGEGLSGFRECALWYHGKPDRCFCSSFMCFGVKQYEMEGQTGCFHPL